MQPAADPPIDVRVAPAIWMRRKEMSDGFVAAYLVLSLLMLALALLPDAHGHRLVLVAAMAPFVFGFILAAWRYRRAGLWISNDGVRVRGLIRDRELTLREAGSFDVGVIGSPGALQAAYGIFLRREGGRPVLIRSLTKFGWNNTTAWERAKAEWQPTADALNELLAGFKGGEVIVPREPRPTRGVALRFTLAYALSSATALALLLIGAVIVRDPTLPLILAAVYLPIAVVSTIYVGRRAVRRVEEGRRAENSTPA